MESIKLICIGIIYKDNSFSTSSSKCKTLAKYIANFYKTNSLGKLDIIPTGVAERVIYTAERSNVKNAEKSAMDRHPGYDIYVMVVGPLISASHASGKVAHVRGFLKRDGAHEVGHLLDLQHSGAYEKELSYSDYGDGLSVMGRFASSYLAAPQYQYKKWIISENIGEYVEGRRVFTINRLTDFKKTGLSMVMFRMDDQNAFVSFAQVNRVYDTNPYLVLHLQSTVKSKGGSRRVASFTKEYHDERFTNLQIVILSSSSKPDTVTFSMELVENAEKAEFKKARFDEECEEGGEDEKGGEDFKCLEN